MTKNSAHSTKTPKAKSRASKAGKSPQSSKSPKQAKSKKAPAEQKYLHGYSAKEQKRLIEQAQSLEPWIYERVDFSDAKTLLEVGCGVGAQTEILLKRWPQLKITAVDLSEVQLAVARKRLQWAVDEGRVEFMQANAEDLSHVGKNFDAAFICWFLEHVPRPDRVLKQVIKRLRPGGRIFCNEVLNATFFLDPYCPAVLKYWFEFNDHQWSIKGHPFIGAQLGNLLLRAGFKKIETMVPHFHSDSRDSKARKKHIEYWTKMLLSAAPSLIEAKRVTPKLIEKMKKELRAVAHTKDSVFFYTWMQAQGARPKKK